MLLAERLRPRYPRAASQLAECMGFPGFDVTGYTKNLQNLYQRREIVRAMLDCQSEIVEPSVNVEEVVGETINHLREILEGGSSEVDAGITEHDAALEMMARIDADSGSRVWTGIGRLDEMLGGFRAGELVLVCGETGTGKTLMARQIARASCAAKSHGLYASLEMLAPHLKMRDVSRVTAISMNRLRSGKSLSPEERQAIMKAIPQFCRDCRILDKTMSLSGIVRVATRLKQKEGLAWVMVDYDELVSCDGVSELDRQQKVAGEMKSLAMRLDIPIILVSQLRKSMGPEDRGKPSLARLYGSGAKVKHASCVLYVDRPYVQELKGSETDAAIVILKNRDGRVGRLQCNFDIHTLVFSDAIPITAAC